MFNVIFDPGHGGSDSGAVNGKLIEKNINLTVGLKLEIRMKKYPGINFKLTRNTDIYLSLDARVKMINAGKADLAISQHINAGGGDGYEVFHSIYRGKGEVFANMLSKEFEGCQNPHGIGVKTKKLENANKDYYMLIRETTPPTVISEYAFLDNPKDNIIIDEDHELEEIASAFERAICKFFCIKIKDDPGMTNKSKILEVQKCINKLGIKDYDNRALVEDGLLGLRTETCIKQLITYLNTLI